jgi:hypothetical protein
MMRGSAPRAPRPAVPRSRLDRIRMPTPAFRHARAFALVTAAALAASQGFAADKKEKSFGKGKPTGSLLSTAQLRDCLDRQDRVHAGVEETTKQQTKLAAERAEIDRRGAELKEQLALLDRKSASAVEVYNGQAQERDRMVDAYEAAVPGFNAKVESLKAEQAAFAKACEGRRYDEAEEMAIRKGK